jgi:hypothetical protein
MADPLVVLRNLLVADTNVIAIAPASRITPVTRPQAAQVPAISLNVVSNEPDNHLQGSSNLATVRVQVEYWAADYDTARDLANKGNTAIAAADRLLVFDVADYDFDVKLYRVAQDFLLWV